MLRAIGIGDNVADIYVNKSIMYPGGNSLNFAVYASKLGAKAAYTGVLGDDYIGNFIKEKMIKLNIDISTCQTKIGENGYACVDLINGDRTFIGGNTGGISKTSPWTFLQRDKEFIKTFDIIHLSINSYVENELVKLSELGIPISCDFSDKYTNEYLNKYAKYIDFAFISCGNKTYEESRKIIRKIHGFGFRFVNGTRGSQGSLFYDGNNFYEQKPKLVKAIDTLGAGDSFLTAFLICYIELANKKGFSVTGVEKNNDRNMAIISSLEFASEFAAEICMINGAFGEGKKNENFSYL